MMVWPVPPSGPNRPDRLWAQVTRAGKPVDGSGPRLAPEAHIDGVASAAIRFQSSMPVMGIEFPESPTTTVTFMR